MSRIDASTVIFFDASCLVSAASSPSGGAAFVWSLCERRFVIAAVSRGVLSETESNLVAKFPERCLDRHREQLRSTSLIIAATFEDDAGPVVIPAINHHDAHVVAGAIAIRADYLLTYDKALEREVTASGINLQAFSPGEFIQTILPRHPAFNLFR